MTDEIGIDESDTSTDLISGAIDAISGAGIPEPIKRNLFKALGKLCTAAVEIPVAYMEGVALEKRAETAARIKLIEKSSKEIAQQMSFDQEYAKAAVKKFGQRVIREQVNLDIIAEQAADKLAAETKNIDQKPTDTCAEINDDWLNVFEKEASQKSTEEMQSMFASILAGEIRRPNTFSIKSVRLLGSLDKQTANLFKRVCSMCIFLGYQIEGIEHIIDARIPSLDRSPSSNGLSEFGLTFDSLNLLQEYGLIIPEYNSWMDYTAALGNKDRPIALPFEFGGEKWGLIEQEGFPGNDLKISGISLTRSGRELMRVVRTNADPRFSTALTAWFESKKVRMVRVSYKPRGRKRSSILYRCQRWVIATRVTHPTAVSYVGDQPGQLDRSHHLDAQSAPTLPRHVLPP